MKRGRLTADRAERGLTQRDEVGTHCEIRCLPAPGCLKVRPRARQERAGASACGVVSLELLPALRPCHQLPC